MLRTRNRKALSSLCPHSKPARNPSIVVLGFEERKHFPPPGWELSRPVRQYLPAGCQPPLSQVHGACSVRTSGVCKGH